MTRKNKIVINCLLVASLFGLGYCSSPPASEWQKKNDELIRKYDLKVIQPANVPRSAIESNLEAAKVKHLESLDSMELHPGVSAKIFWGSSTMVSLLQLTANAKVPEEILPADRFVFVLEGSIDQLIDGKVVGMNSKKREAPDGTHSGTPEIEFVYQALYQFQRGV